MKLEVREQQRLPFRRLLGICLDSLSYRLLRSTVTVFIIVVAIAFLAAIVIENAIGQATQRTVAEQSSAARAYTSTLRDLSEAPSAQGLLRQAATSPEGSAWHRRIATLGGFEPDAPFWEQSREAFRYLQLFQGLPAGRRVLLVQQHQGLAMFDFLAEADNYEAFVQARATMHSLRLPESDEAFADFLLRWPALHDQLRDLRSRYAAAIRELHQAVQPLSLKAAISQYQARGELATFLATCGELGLAVPEADVPHIATGLKLEGEIETVTRQIAQPAIRDAWPMEFDEPFGPMRALIACARQPSRADWIAERLDNPFDKAAFLETARQVAKRQWLFEADRHLHARYGDPRLQSRMVWLVVVSFLVCVVGIANAMLMSVLERFKEIATMKCLGARNGTIGFLFITESVFMGLAGGALGIIAGMLIAILRQWLGYGALVFADFPFLDILRGGAICFGCALLLTAVAAAYPARVAARMPPMEAMRVD